MLSSRLQQTLLKRVQFIDNLTLICTFSQILTLKIHQYQIENQQMYERQLIMVQTFRNIFRIDQSFRRFYYKICMNVFAKLYPRHKKTMAKSIARIHNVYFQFLLFFRGVNELAIARYLCDLNFQTMNENELFIKLTHTLIKYLKIKTESLIEKLKEKSVSMKHLLNRETEDQQYKKKIYEELEKKECMEKKRFNNFLRKSSVTQNLYKRKYNSEDFSPQKNAPSIRKVSFELSMTNHLLSESKDMDKSKGPANMDPKSRLKRFQEYYYNEWQLYYRLTGLSLELFQLKGKYHKIDDMCKKEWTYENYRHLYQEMLMRNQENIQSFAFNKQNQKNNP